MTEVEDENSFRKCLRAHIFANFFAAIGDIAVNKIESDMTERLSNNNKGWFRGFKISFLVGKSPNLF